MPLIGDGIERVEIGADWYELKRELGWYEYQRVEEQRRTMIVPLHAGRMVMEGPLEVHYHEADLNSARLVARLQSWSHPEALNEETIRRLSVSHARVLLARIAELEKAEQQLELDAEGKAPSGA